MRIVVVGGTRFIGRAVVAALLDAGHDVTIVHRGQHEPNDPAAAFLGDVRHIHAALPELHQHAEVHTLRPDVVVDTASMNGAAATSVRDSFADARLVTASSGDAYRAYAGLHQGRWTDAVPLDEDAPRRRKDAGEWFIDGSDMENVQVEDVVLPHGGTVLRLGAVIGPHDYQRRHEFVLRRVRAGRRTMPIGAGEFTFSHVHVGDVAAAFRAVIDAPADDVTGQVFNIAEWPTPAMGLRARAIPEALDVDLKFVTVLDTELPDDMEITGHLTQHLLMDPSKARRVLGWSARPWREALADAVAWELEHPPPEDGSTSFHADDTALDSVPQV